MRYLMLKLDGPMQAWGGHTYEDYRPSELFPTRSGLVGLLAACLGVKRDEYDRLQDLAASIIIAIRAEARHDQAQSTRIIDFHIVQNARKVDGTTRTDPVVSRRQYLCDSIFSVAIGQADEAVFDLDIIAAALKKPVFTPFLGRRSCPLARPLFDGWVDAGSGIEALKQHFSTSGVIYSEEAGGEGKPLRIRDVPSYGRIRQFGVRTVYVQAKGE